MTAGNKVRRAPVSYRVDIPRLAVRAKVRRNMCSFTMKQSPPSCKVRRRHAVRNVCRFKIPNSKEKHDLRLRSRLFHEEQLGRSAVALLMGPPHFFSQNFFEVVIPFGISHGRNIRMKVTQQKVDSAKTAKRLIPCAEGVP